MFDNELAGDELTWQVDENILESLNMKSAKAVNVLLRKALRCFHSSDGPIYIGNVAVSLGLNLRHAHIIIDILVESKHVKALTSEELTSRSLESDHLAYMLSGKMIAAMTSR